MYIKRNCVKILEIAKREVPVYIGCEDPLVEPLLDLPGRPFHGWDGLGDCEKYNDLKGYT